MEGKEDLWIFLIWFGIMVIFFWVWSITLTNTTKQNIVEIYGPDSTVVYLQDQVLGQSNAPGITRQVYTKISEDHNDVDTDSGTEVWRRIRYQAPSPDASHALYQSFSETLAAENLRGEVTEL